MGNGRKHRKQGRSSDTGILIYNHKDLYSGLAEINLRAEHAGFFEKIYKDKFLEAVLFENIVRLSEISANQCCRICLDKKCFLAIYKKKESRFVLIKKEKEFDEKEIRPINEEQAFAYALLTDPQIQLVTLVGKAGTGKTLMSVLAGYKQIDNENTSYGQMLIYRPNIELGQKLGFLPGEKEHKFAPWMPPVLDALNLMAEGKAFRKHAGRAHERRSEKMGDFNFIDEVMEAGLIDIEPINYIRGRSLHGKFVIIDEAQNFGQHEIKTIVTRAGNKTKMVLTGDLSQVDNPKLDARSNGLAHVIKKFKGQEIFGHIVLQKSERSLLGGLAADLL